MKDILKFTLSAFLMLATLTLVSVNASILWAASTVG